MTKLSGEWWSADFHGKVANRAVLEAWGRLEKERDSVLFAAVKRSLRGGTGYLSRC